jgi:hypothetical protein
LEPLSYVSGSAIKRHESCFSDGTASPRVTVIHMVLCPKNRNPVVWLR